MLWRLHRELSIFQFSESPRRLYTVSVHSQWSRQRTKIFHMFKNFQFAAQSQWSLIGVSVGSK